MRSINYISVHMYVYVRGYQLVFYLSAVVVILVCPIITNPVKFFSQAIFPENLTFLPYIILRKYDFRELLFLKENLYMIILS